MKKNAHKKPVFEAMILAAGLGKRLRPLTNKIPKALVEIAGKPLLEQVILKLKKYRVQRIVVNVHHFAGQIIDFLHEKENFGMDIRISDETGHLLGTGGGLKNAKSLFSMQYPVLIHSVDVLSDLDMDVLLRSHILNKTIATLVVRDRDTQRYFLWDRQQYLCGWAHISSGEKKIVRPAEDLRKFAFSSLHVVSPAIFPLITETGAFSIVDLYLRLAQNNRIKAFVDTSGVWKDQGKSIP